MSAWLYRPASLARIAWLRVIAYAFVPVDLLLTTPWVMDHAHVPGTLYQPLRIGEVLHLPTPGGWVEPFGYLLVAVSLVSAVLAARDRLPAWLGYVVAVAYLEWMVIAMSYGKVDHDRVAFLVLLFVLPTVGRARLRDSGASEAAGWALSVVTLAVVATYTLAAVAKLRFGEGLGWLDGATLTRAVVRRHTALSAPLLDHTWVLHAFQYVLMGMELFVAPLLLVRWKREQITWALAVGFLLFHVMTFAMITIIFLPHCVALLSLLPLERLSRSTAAASSAGAVPGGHRSGRRPLRRGPARR